MKRYFAIHGEGRTGLTIEPLGSFDDFEGASDAADSFSSRTDIPVLWISNERELINLRPQIDFHLTPIKKLDTLES